MTTTNELVRRAAMAPIAYVHGQPVYPIKGSRRGGYSTQGDVLVNQTADGVDLNEVWGEREAALAIYNSHVQTLVAHLTYNTDRVSDLEPQSLTGAKFEEASEFGISQSARTGAEFERMSYDFRDYDVRVASTWKFLRDADSRQVAAQFQNVIDGDREHLNKRVMWQITRNTARTVEDPLSGAVHTVFPLYNGDSMVPPTYMGQEFTAPHDHFFVTEGALDASDIENALITHVMHHGFGDVTGSQLLLLAHPTQSGVIQTFRAGQANADGTTSKYDFIPSTAAPAYLTAETIVGERPPGEFNGLRIQGSLGPAWLVESRFVPEGYVICVATGGPGSDFNPVAFREHANPLYRGLRQIPGGSRYPLVDSFFARGFGVGTRRRGAAAVVQVTASTVTTYTPPTFDLP